MSIPPIPSPLEHLGARSFSFYPAILNIEHNEWLFRKATWSEILVHNVKTNEELWIPRRFLGEVSQIEDPVVIVGLVKELEYRGGAVLPHQRRVIEMPLAVGDTPRTPAMPRPQPAPVVGIRLEPGPETRVGRLILGAVLVGVIGTLAVVMATREGTLRPRFDYTNKENAFPDFTARDDYYSIVNKLGRPEQDHATTMAGDLEFRSLWYPAHSYYLILMGSERGDMRYIGAMDKDWNVRHSVSLPRGGNTGSLLRGLPRF
jgi:hypothetical protein